MEQEREDYADAEPLPLPSVRVFVLTLAVLAFLAAIGFYIAVVVPAASC